MSSLILFMVGLLLAVVVYAYRRWLQVVGVYVLHLPSILWHGLWSKVMRWWQQRVQQQWHEMSFTRWTAWFYTVRLWFFRSQERFLSSLDTYFGDTMTIELTPVGSETQYIPESERGKENPATFFFEKKKRSEIAEKKDEIFEVEDGEMASIRGATVQYEITLEQLSDWENITSDGQPVPFKEENKREVYDQLDTDIQDELENEFGGGLSQTEKEQDE